MALGRLHLLNESPGWRAPGHALVRCALVVLSLLVGPGAGPAQGHSYWQEDHQRLHAGLDVFPAVLGGLVDLDDKASTEGDLPVAVAHAHSPEAGRHAASALQAMEPIRGHPLRVIVLEAAALDTYEGPPLAGIFVASIGMEGPRLRAWSERLRTLVFSPFAGDVESGAVAGLHVSAQVLPFLNLSQARRAGVRFRHFLLRVSRHHE